MIFAQQQIAQRLTVAVEPQGRVDAALQCILDHEIQSVQLR